MKNDEPHIDSPSDETHCDSATEGDALSRFSPPSGDDEAGATRAGTDASAQADPTTHFVAAPDTPHAYSKAELSKYAPPGRRGYRKRSTATKRSATTKRTPASTPTSAATASSQAEPDSATAPATATAPGQLPSEEETKTASRNLRIAFWLVFSAALLIAHLVHLGNKANTPAPVRMPYLASTQAPTTPSPGYSGTAHNTHALSPAWAAGISTAWTIPTPSGVANVTHPMHVEGSTLYVAYGVAMHANSSTYTVGAYDLTGRMPQPLWATPVRTDTPAAQSDYVPSFVSGDDQIFFRGTILDKATGNEASAPWGKDFPLAFAENIVVTCSATTTCSGWTQEGDEWTNLWTTTTATQASDGVRENNLGFAPAGTVVSGSGERTSVLVPTASNELPQIIDIHSGAVTSLSSPDGDATDRLVEVASDGFIVFEKSTSRGWVFDSEGNFQSTLTAEHNLPVPSMDGTRATTSQIEAFMTQGKAEWATGTARMTGTGECTLEVALTSDDSTREAPVPYAARLHTHDDCALTPEDLRVSADGSALYVRSFSPGNTTSYVIDTADGSSDSSRSLTQATQLTWVFDDMLIGMSTTGITAFVPASS
ncbi:hypothetical protein [Actinomyces sp.]